MSGNRRHAGGMTSAMANLKKYDLAPEDRHCDMCRVDPVVARNLKQPEHLDWCPHFAPTVGEKSK